MTNFRLTCASMVLASSFLATGPAVAYEGGSTPSGGAAETGGAPARNVMDERNRPLIDGSYAAIMGQYRISQDDEVLDKGAGVNALLGYRNRGYGLEGGFGYSGGDGIKMGHFIFNVLAYPFESIPMFYGLVGVGASRYQDYPFERSPRPIEGNKGFVTGNLQGGLGYIVPLRWNDYEYGLRVEALYRYSDRFIERESDNIADIAAPSIFKDVLINLGLHMPLRKPMPTPPPPEPEEMRVVEVMDSDGDGVPDDIDQCPDTPPGVRVDSVGCPLPPPPPACGEVRNGGVPSLEGCGVGDSIVLRGVNFETNRANLTVNARTLLDDVILDLKNFPDIKVEVGGHTDSRGAADYNQALSERRANSVRDYLASNGIAPDRMTTRGYGLENPIADNATMDGQDRNRRVELKITGGSATRGTTRTGAATPAASPTPAPTAAPMADDAELYAPAAASPTPRAATPAPTSAPTPAPTDDADAALDDLFDF